MYRVPIIVALFTLALSVVACGGGGDAEATMPAGNTQPTATTEQAAQPTEAPADDDGEQAVAAGDPENGQQLYTQSCSSCHGPDATGIENLGRDLTNNEFIQNNSDEELLAFVKEGRPAGDPNNTTGVDMPPKGGNPAITDEQILDIIAYLRTLQ